MIIKERERERNATVTIGRQKRRNHGMNRVFSFFLSFFCYLSMMGYSVRLATLAASNLLLLLLLLLIDAQ
jgi:hypothetical protein